MERIIVGLTGSFGSGCTSVSEILGRKGFQRISLSQFLVKEADKRGIDVASLPRQERRKKLQDIGNELRKKDAGFLIKEAFKLADKDKDVVIESIKNPGEIKELKKFSHSYVMALDTNFESRKDRILLKEYDGDLKSFGRDNKREKDEGIEYGQKLQACVDLADILIKNDKDRHTPQENQEFEERIMKDFIQLLKSPGSDRIPTDLELWMNNAYSISLQSECLKRQVGAVIVKNGYAIATGKNNVAPDEKPCKEVYLGKCYRDTLRSYMKYCPICKKELDEDFNCADDNCVYNKENLNKLLDKCKSLHAEENAILQACYLGGVPLEGSVLYTTTFPCGLCANKIVAVGIKEVIYVEAYPDRDSVEFFKRHPKITLTKFEGVKSSAFYYLFKAKNY